MHFKTGPDWPVTGKKPLYLRTGTDPVEPVPDRQNQRNQSVNRFTG